FSQEFAPTSIAAAEIQSMFLDSFLSDPVWLHRYARNAKGEPIPVELLREMKTESLRFGARGLRRGMVVPFAEKAIYELKENELTPERVLQVVRETEHRLLGGDSAMPTLAIPHPWERDTSAYYHSYILAELAVYQTRRFFMRKFGSIVDNPRLGRELTKFYWAPGNSLTFLEYVTNLTGENFSADAAVSELTHPISAAGRDVEEALELEARTPHPAEPVNLNVNLIMEHGGQVITDNMNGKSFEQMAEEYAQWLQKQTEAKRLGK
ncbi:MAG: peptidase M3, partial [Bdellovibrio sp.]